jgi:hypothetical protein
MPQNRYRGPPMTLANMRARAVRSLRVVCELFHHQAVANVDGYGRCRAGAGARPTRIRRRRRAQTVCDLMRHARFSHPKI